jgi:hypothetical protein
MGLMKMDLSCEEECTGLIYLELSFQEDDTGLGSMEAFFQLQNLCDLYRRFEWEVDYPSSVAMGHRRTVVTR